MAALLAAAVARHQHAGGIQPGFAKKTHLRSAHAGIGTGVHGADERRQPLRMGHRIVVERGHIRGSRGAKPLVDCPTETGIARVLNHARARRRTVAAYQAAAAIIDDHHFEIWPRLPGEGLHALQKPRIRSESGDYHRYEEIRQFLILPIRNVAGQAPSPTANAHESGGADNLGCSRLSAGASGRSSDIRMLH